jgi:hypothetical protein
MTDAERDAVADAPGDSSIVTWEPGGSLVSSST